MKASYELMTSHIKSLIKHTWPTTVPYACLMACTLFFALPNKPLHDWGLQNPWLSFILQTIVYGATIILSFVAGTSVWGWINHKPFKKNIRPYALLSLILIILQYIPTGIFSRCQDSVMAIAYKGDAKGTLTVLGIIALLLVVILILSLPFCYIIPKRMLLEEGEKMQYKKAFFAGLRHSGGFFSTIFLGTMILLTLTIIVCLPSCIIFIAQLYSQLGALEGDSLGVPSYFTPLLFVVLAITSFIEIYLTYWLAITLAYQYGSYKVQEEEKMKLKLQDLSQNILA